MSTFYLFHKIKFLLHYTGYLVIKLLFTLRTTKVLISRTGEESRKFKLYTIIIHKSKTYQNKNTQH